MKKFWGLLKREHMQNGAHSYGVLALITIAIMFLPIGVEQYSAMYRAEEIRLIAVVGCALAIGLNAIFMSVASINRDVKTRELWLHNTQSIYKLIGAKIAYQFCVMLVLGFVNFVGLFFVGELIEGTFGQFLVLACFYFYLMVGGFFIFVILTVFYNSFLKQLVAWIGKIAYVIGFVGLIALISLGDTLPSATFLQVGHIALPNMEAYLPTFNQANISINAYTDFYIVEEVFFLAIFIGIYVLACKWLERVITR